MRPTRLRPVGTHGNLHGQRAVLTTDTCDMHLPYLRLVQRAFLFPLLVYRSRIISYLPYLLAFLACISDLPMYILPLLYIYRLVFIEDVIAFHEHVACQQ